MVFIAGVGKCPLNKYLIALKINRLLANARHRLGRLVKPFLQHTFLSECFCLHTLEYIGIAHSSWTTIRHWLM